MSRILIYTLCLYCCLSGKAQQVVVGGVVTDTNGARLPYVNVKASSMNSNKQVASFTDEDGRYSIELDNDSNRLEFSYIGYKTYYIDIPQTPKGNLVKDVALEIDSVELTEVIIHGNYMVREKDKDIYFPSHGQRISSNSGIDLLYNMMIPCINFDKDTGNATTTDNKKITSCINGIPASIHEIKSIRPQDIIRLDYYPIGVGKFSKYEAVLDYVVKIYDHSGYLSIKSLVKPFDQKESLETNNKIHHNNWTHLFYGEFLYNNDRRLKTFRDEIIQFDPILVKKTESDKSCFKELNSLGMYSVTYQKNNFSFKINSLIKWNSIPKEDYLNHIQSTLSTVSTQADVSQSSKGISPSCDATIEIGINNKQSLSLNFNYDYINCTYRRRYIESDILSIENYSEGNNYIIGGNADYSHNLNDKIDLSVGASIYKEHYKTEYSGNTETKQILGKEHFTSYLTLRSFLSRNFYFMLDFKLMRHFAHVNNINDKTWLFLPNAYISYDAGIIGKFVLSWQSVYVNLPIEWKSSLSQQINSYEIVKGNESLPHFTAFQPYLTYYKDWSNLQINAYYGSMFSSKSIRDKYYVKNGSLIHTYTSAGAYFQTLCGLKATIFAFDKRLSLSGGITYNMRRLNNDEEGNYNDLTYSLRALYNIKDISFQIYYLSKWKQYGITGSMYYMNPEKYGIIISVSNQKWYASIELTNFLKNRRYQTNYISSLSYQLQEAQYMKEYYPSLAIKLAYTLNYGRKKLEHDNIIINKEINYGILRIK